MSNESDKKSNKALIAVIQEALSMTSVNTLIIDPANTSLLEVEGASSESSKNDTLLEDKLLKIHLQNYREKLSLYKPIISAVIDQPDFQPVSFLQLGLEKSYAVCRISWYCSKKMLKELFKNLKEKAKEKELDKILEQSPGCNPSEELKSIFLIPDNLFYKIFKKTTQCAIKRTFVDSIECLEENIDEILKLNPLPIGTGFLVGNSHLLTNHHVIPTPKIAQECVAQFGYEDEPTKIVKILDYEFDSKLLFVTNPHLDYTLVQLQTDAYNKRPAGYNFGWLDLIESEENIAPRLKQDQVEKLINNKLNNDGYSYTREKLDFYGLTKGNELEGDRVAIIQHPRGRKKEIILHNNEVTDLSLENLNYKADTDYGSSGSPVFNMNWKLVALTKRVIPQSNTQNLPCSWDVSQGTRICRIVEDLKKNSFTNPKLQSFIEDFVFTSEQLNFPPLLSGLEFDGNSSYVDLNIDNLETIDAITVEVLVQRHPASGDGTIIHQPNVYCLYWSVGRLFLQLYDGTSERAIFEVNTYKACLNDGLWHHVAFTYDLKNNNDKPIIIYVDGKEEGIYNPPSSNDKKWIDAKNRISFKDNLYKVYLGCKKNKDNNYCEYFKGSISEIRYWNVARNQKEIEQNMKRRLHIIKEKKLLKKEGLIGYWRFEEGEEYRVYNLVSKAKSSAVTKQAKIDYSRDTGLEFNGVSDYVDCGKNKKLNFGKAITMESWFNLNGKPLEGFIINQGGSWGQPGCSLWFLNKNTIRVELCDAKGSQIFFDTKYNCHDDSWHHIAFTWSMAPDCTQSFQMYIDGETKGIKYSFLQHYQQPISTKKTFTENNESIYQIKEDISYFQNGIGKPKVNLNIGRAQDYARYFNGSIGEVRLWNVVRTEQQIKENMNSYLLYPAKEEGLVGYWRLDEEEGDKAKDSSNNAMDGNVYGGKWLKPYYLMEKERDVFGVAFRTKSLRASQYPALDLPWGLKFSNKQYYDCGNDDKLNTPEAITVEAWVKQTFGDCLIVNCVNGNGDLLRNGDTQAGYSLSWYEGKICVILSDGNPQNKTIVYSKNAPSDNMWHHIAFTWSYDLEQKQKGEIAIYIDGRYQDCIVEGKSNALIIQGRSKMTGIFTGVLDNLKTNLTIGKRANFENDTYRDFEIAEVRLWNVARTQQEIQANMYRRLKQGLEEPNNLIECWCLDDVNAQYYS